MKIALIFIMTFFYVGAFSQNVESIENLIQKINSIQFKDSIIIYDTSGIPNRPIQIVGYLTDDSLLKSVARFKNSNRLRFTYYNNNFYPVAVYAKDVDSISGEVFSEIYGDGYNVYKTNIKRPLEKEEKNYPYQLLQNSNYSTQIGFAVVDRKAKKYHFKAKLVKAVPRTPGCGTLAWAIVQKFEIVSTTFPNYDKQFVLVIQPCPEFLDNGFFEKNKIYEIDVATNSGVTFGYTLINGYEKENLPIFWTRQIKKID